MSASVYGRAADAVPLGRKSKPQPATLSMFEWALTPEQGQEAEADEEAVLYVYEATEVEEPAEEPEPDRDRPDIGLAGGDAR